MKKKNSNSMLALNKATITIINSSKIMGGDTLRAVPDSIALIGKDTVASPKIKI